MLARFTVLFVFLTLTQGPLGAQMPAPSPEREAVKRAVMDYVDGFYEGDSTKLVRSIRPEFYKYGFYRESDTTAYRGSRMTWEAANGYANRVKQNRSQQPATAVKRVEVLDVQDQTAAAKLTAWWGTDYLLLGKYDGKWMISHVLWQSPPPKTAR
jgi:hypothetical protein